MNRAYRLALACGAIPLLMGVSVFLLWLITRWDGLMVAGMVTLCGGMALFLIGVVALMRYWSLASQTPDIPSRHLRRSTFLCAGLLLLNFPVAGGIVAAVIAIETCYTVVVENDSHRPLEGVRVFGGGCDEQLGTIPAGSSVRQWLWIRHDGTLELRALADGASYHETIDGYVTNSMGGHTTVTIHADGTISFGGTGD